MYNIADLLVYPCFALSQAWQKSKMATSWKKLIIVFFVVISQEFWK